MRSFGLRVGKSKINCLECKIAPPPSRNMQLKPHLDGPLTFRHFLGSELSPEISSKNGYDPLNRGTTAESAARPSSAPAMRADARSAAATRALSGTCA